MDWMQDFHSLKPNLFNATVELKGVGGGWHWMKEGSSDKCGCVEVGYNEGCSH